MTPKTPISGCCAQVSTQTPSQHLPWDCNRQPRHFAKARVVLLCDSLRIHLTLIALTSSTPKPTITMKRMHVVSLSNRCCPCERSVFSVGRENTHLQPHSSRNIFNKKTFEASHHPNSHSEWIGPGPQLGKLILNNQKLVPLQGNHNDTV